MSEHPIARRSEHQTATQRSKRKPCTIEIRWLNEPSPEAIMRAQLRLLGLTTEEINRSLANIDKG